MSSHQTSQANSASNGPASTDPVPTGASSTEPASTAPAPIAPTPHAARRSVRPVLLALLLAALLAGGVLSYFASQNPDGLEKVSDDLGVAASAKEHAAAGGPLADYQVRGVDEGWLSGGLAGVIGVLAVALIGTALFWLLRRRQPQATAVSAPSGTGAGTGTT